MMCLCAAVHAQSEDAHATARGSVFVGMGAIHSRLIDEGFTDRRLLFRGTNTAWQLGYERHSEKYIFNVIAVASHGDLTSASGNVSTDFLHGAFTADYLRTIHNGRLFEKQNDLFAGVRLGTINQATVSMRAVDNVRILSLHGAYFQLQNRVTLDDRQSVQVSAQFPLAIYENNVLWNGGASHYTYREVTNIPRLMFTQGRTAVFPVTRNIQFNVNYARRIGKRTCLEVRYNFFYYSNSDVEPLRTYSNSLLAGLRIGR